MVVIVSPHSAQSPHVQAEYQYFVTQKKPIIPVIYKVTETSFLLDIYQRIYFVGRDYDDALKDLLISLEIHGVNLNHPNSIRQNPIPIPPTPPHSIGEIIPYPEPIPPEKRPLWFYVLWGIVGLIVLFFVSVVSSGNFSPFAIPTPTPPPTVIPTQIPTPMITPPPIQYCVITAFQIRRGDGTLHRVSVTQAFWEVKPNEIIQIEAVISGCEFAVSLYQWQAVKGTVTLVKDGSINYRASTNTVEDEITLIMPLNDGDKEAVLFITVADD